jgi:putative hydrolase of the HAD superfamily
MRSEAGALVADAQAANVPVGVLTNDLTAFHGDGAMARQKSVRRGRAGHGSVTGVLKPDPRAYALADALGHPASAIVFVDDMPWNV